MLLTSIIAGGLLFLLLSVVLMLSEGNGMEIASVKPRGKNQ